MKRGTTASAARAVSITIQFLDACVKGRKNASAPVADRLAALTKTDIRVWLQGGSAEDRVAALKAWSSFKERNSQ
jgi:plasmid maintenance system antidote protein VapI